MYLSFTCNRHVSTQQVWCCSRMFRRRHLPRFASSSLYRLPHLSQSNSLSPPQKGPSPPCTLPQPTADHSHAPPCILQSDPGETPLFPAAWAAAPCSHQTVHQPTSGLGHSQGRFRLCSGETPGVPHAAHARRDVMSGAPSVQTSSDRSNSILTINKIMQWQHQAVRVEHAPAGWSVNWATCSEDSAPLKLTIRTPTPGGGGGGEDSCPARPAMTRGLITRPGARGRSAAPSDNQLYNFLCRSETQARLRPEILARKLVDLSVRARRRVCRASSRSTGPA